MLERATPSIALTFVPLLLALHYARLPMGVFTGAMRRAPRTHLGPLDSVLNAASMDPEQIAAVLHGVLLGPVAPTYEQRVAIAAPTLVLAHRADVLHPFSDARSLAGQVPWAQLVQARSPLELRLRPRRLTARSQRSSTASGRMRARHTRSRRPDIGVVAHDRRPKAIPSRVKDVGTFDRCGPGPDGAS